VEAEASGREGEGIECQQALTQVGGGGGGGASWPVERAKEEKGKRLREEGRMERQGGRVEREGGRVESAHTSSATVSRAAQHGQFVGQFLLSTHAGETSPARHGQRSDVTLAFERRERRLVIFYFFCARGVWEHKAAHATRILYVLYMYILILYVYMYITISFCR
jgi:hypothetical protein